MKTIKKNTNCWGVQQKIVIKKEDEGVRKRKRGSEKKRHFVRKTKYHRSDDGSPDSQYVRLMKL